MSGNSNPFGKLLTSGSVLFLGIVVQLGVNFVAKVLIARWLGKVDYGAVSLGVTLLMTTSVLVLVGTDTGVSRYLPRRDDVSYRRGVLLSAFKLVIPVSVGVGALIALLAEPISVSVFHDPSLTPILRIFGLAVPLTAFFRLTIGGVRGMQETLPRVYLQNFTLPVVRFCLVAVAVAAGLGSVGIAWAYAGAYGTVSALSLFFLARETPLFDSVEATPMHSELLRFSLPLMITATMSMVLSNIDIFMLGFFTTTGDVGIYNVAYPLASLLTVMLTAFGFLFMPVISELHASEERVEMKRVYQIVSKWIFLATLPIFLVIASYADVVIRATFGAEYASGGIALTILAFGFFTHALSGPSGDTLTAMGHSRLIMYDNVIVAVVNVVLNVILIPQYSYVGAAVATTVGYLVMNGLYISQLYRRVGVHPFRTSTFKPGLAAATLWVAFTAAINSNTDVTFLTLTGIAACFAILYLGVAVVFGGVEQEELGLLARLDERVGIDLTVFRRIARRFVT